MLTEIHPVYYKKYTLYIIRNSSFSLYINISLMVASTQKTTANNSFEALLSLTQVDKEKVCDPARRLFRTLFEKSVTKDGVQVFDPLNMFKGT